MNDTTKRTLALVVIVFGLLVAGSMDYEDEVNASSAYVNSEESIKAAQSRTWRKM